MCHVVTAGPFLRGVRHPERKQNDFPVGPVRAPGGVERNDLVGGDPHPGRFVGWWPGVRAVRIKSANRVRIGGEAHLVQRCDAKIRHRAIGDQAPGGKREH